MGWDSHLYDDLWSRLNGMELRPMGQDQIESGMTLEFSTVLEHFKKTTSSKIINLAALGKTDEAYLAARRIEPAYLVRNLQKTLQPRFADPRAFQLNALRTRAIHAICPFSGKEVTSSHSLLANINVIFYRFRTEGIFYVITAGIGPGFKKSALYFPELDLIVTSGEAWTFEQEDLVELKARMVSSFFRCYEYLCSAAKETVICTGFYHFAHHLWNELSGLERIKDKRLFKNIDKVLLLREPLGSIEQIFPEIAAERVRRYATTQDLFEDILANRYFAVKVGGDFIASDLTARVYKAAQRNATPAIIDRIKRAKARHSPLLWIGIRVGNRAWADQADGISQLIHALYRKFPKIGIIFDGFSVPGDRTAYSNGDAGYDSFVEQENAVVHAIVEKLSPYPEGSPEMFNIIGASIFEANLWAHAIDFYISPYGSLQHKVGWLARKPGIIHTNQTLLENPAKYVWTAVEKAIPPRYVRRESINDVESGDTRAVRYNEIPDTAEMGAGVLAMNSKVRSNPEFNNYRVNWMHLRDDLLDLIRSSNTVFAPAPILLDRSRIKLKQTIQRVATAFDSSSI